MKSYPVKIYHIVHINRLASIISQGCLWSDAIVQSKSFDGTMIGVRLMPILGQIVKRINRQNFYWKSNFRGL